MVSFGLVADIAVAVLAAGPAAVGPAATAASVSVALATTVTVAVAVVGCGVVSAAVGFLSLLQLPFPFHRKGPVPGLFFMLLKLLIWSLL